MTRGCARRTRESMKIRKFLVCGWRRVPVDADDHVERRMGVSNGSHRPVISNTGGSRYNMSGARNPRYLMSRPITRCCGGDGRRVRRGNHIGQ